MMRRSNLALVVVVIAVCSAHIQLQPGHTSVAGWPRYLFVFRGAMSDFRLQEVRAAAGTLGVDLEQLKFEPATELHALAGSSSIGPDLSPHGPDLFHWVSLPTPALCAAVAERCSLVRLAVDVWAEGTWPRDGGTHDVSVALERADERWQNLADALQATDDPGSMQRARTCLGLWVTTRGAWTSHQWLAKAAVVEAEGCTDGEV